MDLNLSNAGLGARGSDSAGIIVVDRACRILFKNRLAEGVLASGRSLHHGHNADAGGVVQVLSFNVSPRGSSSRVGVPPTR